MQAPNRCLRSLQRPICQVSCGGSGIPDEAGMHLEMIDLCISHLGFIRSYAHFMMYIMDIASYILHISSTIVVPPDVFKISSPEYPGSAKHIDRRSSWRFQHFSLDAALAWLRERRSSAVCKPNARNLGETVQG